MTRKNLLSYFGCFIILFSCSSDDNSDSGIPMDGTPDPELTYFPPNDGSDIWETKSASDLDWNTDELQPLLDFLEDNNSKSFMILHNGKIVVESYMNNHNSSQSTFITFIS